MWPFICGSLLWGDEMSQCIFLLYSYNEPLITTQIWFQKLGYMTIYDILCDIEKQTGKCCKMPCYWFLLKLNSANYLYLNKQTHSSQITNTGLKEWWGDWIKEQNLFCISLSLTLVVSLHCKMVCIWSGVFVASRASSSGKSRTLCWPGGFWKPSPTFKVWQFKRLHSVTHVGVYAWRCKETVLNTPV